MPRTRAVESRFYRVWFRLDWNKDEHHWDTYVDYEAAQFAKRVKAFKVEMIREIQREFRTVEIVDVSKFKH